MIFEPGRLIAGNAGILVTRVLYVKRAEAKESGKTFVIVDAGMNDLIRPTLYDAYHEIVPVALAAGARPKSSPMSSARSARRAIILALDRRMPEPRPGDLLAVISAGAYGAVQAGTYNSRLLVPEVLVNGDAYAVVRPRETYDQLIGLDKLPPWLR